MLQDMLLRDLMQLQELKIDRLYGIFYGKFCYRKMVVNYGILLDFFLENIHFYSKKSSNIP